MCGETGQSGVSKNLCESLKRLRRVGEMDDFWMILPAGILDILTGALARFQHKSRVSWLV